MIIGSGTESLKGKWADTNQEEENEANSVLHSCVCVCVQVSVDTLGVYVCVCVYVSR